MTLGDQRLHYVTRSGLAADLYFEGEQKAPNRDAWQLWYTIRTRDGTDERACVLLVAPLLFDMHLKSEGLGSVEETKGRIGLLAVLENLDGLSDVPADPYGNRLIEIRSEDAVSLLRGPRQSDREIRRFLTRRIYDAYSRTTLRTPCTLDAYDYVIAGADENAMLRNLQLLEDEGYIVIQGSSPSSVTLLPRAKLVREVERFGASHEDAVGEGDLLSAIGAYTGLKPHEQAITAEYRRFSTARTAIELESVFRAVAPIVEAVLKEVLSASGSAQQQSTLGPAINELRQRNLGSIGLIAQLSHVLKFARDLSQHGSSLPEPVLRIACENCFQLLPQLGAVFPPAT